MEQAQIYMIYQLEIGSFLVILIKNSLNLGQLYKDIYFHFQIVTSYKMKQ